MPLFDYVCSACEAEIEVIGSAGDPPPTCAICGTPMRRKVSRCSFALKGAGWANDGYGLHAGKARNDSHGGPKSG